MIIHFYDFQNKNKIGQVNASEFTSLKIDQTIDDFHTCVLSHTINDRIGDLGIQGFENVYIEDEGRIIFGGVLASYTASPQLNTFNIFDHRWMLSRLILDNPIEVSSTDDILNAIESLIDLAKSKREIPLIFDREASELNPDYAADLRFEVGDTIAGSLQKIIQTIYARWAVEYRKEGNQMIGSLRVRSAIGVTPQGIGRSRGNFTNETGEFYTMQYVEGDPTNTLQNFQLTYDLTPYASRAKVGTRIGGVSNFVTAQPVGNSGFFEFFFGRTETYTTDYNANSLVTANAISEISQVSANIDLTVTLVPDFEGYIIPGDRVNLKIDSPQLADIDGNLVRVDRLSYDFKDGYLERTLLLNFVSPQKRAGTTGFLQAVNDIKQRLDGLDKSYLTS